MHRATCNCESEQQAAGRIFVVRIILNDFASAPACRISSSANISLNCALEGMSAELAFTSSELSRMSSSVFMEWGPSTIAEALLQYNSVQHEGVRDEICERGTHINPGEPKRDRRIREMSDDSRAVSLIRESVSLVFRTNQTR